jgi:PTS system galactitol-specific IIA component
MLGKEIIMRELTAVDLEAETYEDVFEKMAPKFLELGYVNEKYLPTIKVREAQYPTALPVEPYPIAIPHTEADAIIRPFIAPVRLKNTVKWGDMSNPDNKFDVKLVFMLGFKDPGEHIELLQILVYNFQKPEWVNKLFAAKTDQELYDAVLAMEWKHD